MTSATKPLSMGDPVPVSTDKAIIQNLELVIENNKLKEELQDALHIIQAYEESANGG